MSAIWKLRRRLNCFERMSSQTAHRAGYLTVAMALLTATVVRGDLIFQESCDSTAGAARTLPATSSIQGGTVFTNGSGNYLNSTAQVGSNTITVATYSPATVSNSWAALLGAPVTNGAFHYLNLNGAFDVFVRPNFTESGSAWFRPVDVEYGGPLRIIFNGSGTGQLQLEVATTATALGSAPGSFTAVNTWALPGAISSVPNLFTSGAVTHYGITFNTASNGQITMKVFGAAGPGSLDTTSATLGVGNLLAKQSFYANADTIGPNPLPSGAWAMTARPAGTTFAAATSVDYDTVRLYNSVPGTFPTVASAPGPVPEPDWSTYEARRDWLMAVGWPAPNTSAKYGMAANLATFYNYPAGSAQSDLAVSYTTNNLGQLQTTNDLGLSDFYPLGVVRAIYQFGSRFTAAQLARIGYDAQRMLNYDGGGTENMNLMHLSNGYLLAQMFPTNANVWSTGNGSVKVNSATLMASNKESLRQLGQAQYQRSCLEAISPNYLLIHIIPMEQLYEFAQDSEVKSIAGAMLAQMMAQLSANVYRGYIMDPYSRFYNSCFTSGGIGPGADDGQKNDVLLLNWLYWNQGVPEPSRFTVGLADNSYLVYAALSAYHPLSTFERIANVSSDNPGKAHWVKTSEPNSQDGSALIPHVDCRRVWRDREFAMGSVVGYFNPNGFYNQSSSRLGIAYRSNDRLNYLQAGHPYWLADESDLSWWQAPQSPFMQVAHHKNTAIVMFNIPLTDPWPTNPPSRPDYYTTDRSIDQIRRSEHWNSLRTECSMRYPIFMDETNQVLNADGTTWYFLREGQTYIGIRTLNPAQPPELYTNFWVCLFSDAVAHGGRSQSGFVIEIGTSTNAGGQFASFASFQSALTPRKPVVTWGSGSTPSLFVQYTNAQNLVLSASYDTNLTSDVNGKVHMFPVVSENGVPDLSDPWPDLDARLDDTHPMATMTNSVLTITDPVTGGMVERVDWTGSLPVITLGPPIFLPPALGKGQVTLNWTGSGTLQWAPTVQGAWTSIPLAVSPYTEPLVLTNRFFRFQ